MMTDIPILYEDEDIIVCVKPVGILSQGDKDGNKDLVRELKKHLVISARKNKQSIGKEPYIAVVHRLDRNVRGIMVYAKTKRAAAGLSKQIAENKLSKRYMAVVSFTPERCTPEINVEKKRIDYIAADKVKNISTIAEKESKGAERAELNYKVIKTAGNKALVQVDLITGRHHQIRLQLSQIFNGIVGDTKYNNDYKLTDGWKEPALEAVELSFAHPVSGEKLSFAIQPKGKEFGEI